MIGPLAVAALACCSSARCTPTRCTRLLLAALRGPARQGAARLALPHGRPARRGRAGAAVGHRARGQPAGAHHLRHHRGGRGRARRVRRGTPRDPRATSSRGSRWRSARRTTCPAPRSSPGCAGASRRCTGRTPTSRRGSGSSSGKSLAERFWLDVPYTRALLAAEVDHLTRLVQRIESGDLHLAGSSGPRLLRSEMTDTEAVARPLGAGHRILHDPDRHDHRVGRQPRDHEGPRHRLQRGDLGDERLPARLRRAAADHRPPRRPLRPEEPLPHRPRDLHARLGLVRILRHHRRAHRRPCRAGPRRRAHDAADDGRHHPHLPARAPRRGHGPLGRDRRSSRRSSARSSAACSSTASAGSGSSSSTCRSASWPSCSPCASCRSCRRIRTASTSSACCCPASACSCSSSASRRARPTTGASSPVRSPCGA